MPPVFLTHAARDDFDALLAFIGTRSPAGAEHAREHMIDTLASLSEFPARFPVAAESAEWGREVRSVVVYRYRVLYEVRPSQVRVLRIVHGHMQRPVSILR